MPLCILMLGFEAKIEAISAREQQHIFVPCTNHGLQSFLCST
jgi:hypothetical protein